MADLSHWDFAEHFSSYDAAALILGYEPSESEEAQGRIRIVTDRMEMHFELAKSAAFENLFGDYVGSEDNVINSPEIGLTSVRLDALHRRCAIFGEETPLSDWLADRRLGRFENQEFSRKNIADWLEGIGMASRYAFRRKDVKANALSQVLPDVDPLDLPPELDAANMAFMMVSKGYGDQAATPRNRLVEYLEKHYPDFKSDAVQRIATVANPDKSTGRKKTAKE